MITHPPLAELEEATLPRRRRPAWIPTVAAFATIALCITAGNWQHRRMLEKEALQNAMQQAAQVAPVAFPRGAADWSAWRFRQVVASGEYDPRHQILIDNKVHDARVGFDVVTLLRLQDGRAVLVDRGWIAAGPTRAVLPEAPPPRGLLDVRGRIDVPGHGYYELGAPTSADGAIWQHLDPRKFTELTGIDVAPVVVEALDAAGGGAGLVRDWPLPDAGIDTHLSYMIQWYTFAAMAAGLWLWFTFVRRPRAGKGARQ
jgi:surfeit locus 1 family protein